jgi:hypothetical protein
VLSFGGLFPRPSAILVTISAVSERRSEVFNQIFDIFNAH